MKYSILKLNCDETKRITKRIIIFRNVQTPCNILAKEILQQRWQLNMSWDESVPMSFYTKWVKFKSQLSILKDLNILRRVVCENPTKMELHEFSDASEIENSENLSGEKCVHLWSDKSTVAHLTTVTIPRLELCAVLLLVKLFKMVLKSVT